jgi:hypothetical protein
MSSALASINRGGYALFVVRGAKGRRVISAPQPWLKDLQRKANRLILDNIPISDAVFSCRGRGVVANAKQHLGNRYMSVLDIAGCFPSTSVSMVREAFDNLGLRPAVAGTLTRLCTYHGFLPQGAPTSPGILNIVFRPIDEGLIVVANRHHAIYTRYMDDLAFSGMRSLAGLDRHASRLLRTFGYRSNPKKRRIWGPGDRHTLTKIQLGTSLRADDHCIETLNDQLCAFREGDNAPDLEEVQGRIAWVMQLNRAQGRTFERELRRIIATRDRTVSAGAVESLC